MVFASHSPRTASRLLQNALCFLRRINQARPARGGIVRFLGAVFSCTPAPSSWRGRFEKLRGGPLDYICGNRPVHWFLDVFPQSNEAGLGPLPLWTDRLSKTP